MDSLNETGKNCSNRFKPIIDATKAKTSCKKKSRRVSQSSAQYNTSAIESKDGVAVQKLVEQLAVHIEDVERDLTAHIDQKTGQLVLKIMDPETNEMIKTIPPQHLIDIAERSRKNNNLPE